MKQDNGKKGTKTKHWMFEIHDQLSQEDRVNFEQTKNLVQFVLDTQYEAFVEEHGPIDYEFFCGIRRLQMLGNYEQPL